MSDWQHSLASAAAAMSLWEVAAVVLALLYLGLAIRQNIWCWVAAFASTSIYLVLMYAARLYMESALQLFYLAMAVYGWYQWRAGAGPDDSLSVTTWEISVHARAIGGIIILSIGSGVMLDAFSDAAFPYVDSFTTWGAMVATWMVARKILENWLYWFVIDSVSIYLYANRELYLTAVLFAVYLVLIVFGYFAWRRQRQSGFELVEAL